MQVTDRHSVSDVVHKVEVTVGHAASVVVQKVEGALKSLYGLASDEANDCWKLKLTLNGKSKHVDDLLEMLCLKQVSTGIWVTSSLFEKQYVPPSGIKKGHIYFHDLKFANIVRTFLNFVLKTTNHVSPPAKLVVKGKSIEVDEIPSDNAGTIPPACPSGGSVCSDSLVFSSTCERAPSSCSSDRSTEPSVKASQQKVGFQLAIDEIDKKLCAIDKKLTEQLGQAETKLESWNTESTLAIQKLATVIRNSDGCAKKAFLQCKSDVHVLRERADIDGATVRSQQNSIFSLTEKVGHLDSQVGHQWCLWR